MTNAIDRIGGTEIGQVGVERHLEVYDRNTCFSSGGNNLCGWRNRLLNAGYVDAGTVEHPSGGPEVVLHVDYEHGGLSGIELTRAGLRINPYGCVPDGRAGTCGGRPNEQCGRGCPHQAKEPPPTHIGSSLAWLNHF
jgi:hypothetical protein